MKIAEKFHLLMSDRKSKLRLAIAGGVLVTFAIVGSVIYAITRTDTSRNTEKQRTDVTTKLMVESTPGGVIIGYEPVCDGIANPSISPFVCEKRNEGIEITLTAPAEATVESKMYTFKNWDGCSESNSDHKICKVSIEKGKDKTATAVYETAKIPPPPPSPGKESANKVNDQSCTLSTTSFTTLGVGIGRGISSSTGKGSICTLRLGNPPKAGFQVFPQVAFTQVNYIDCGTDCDKYDEFAASSYYNWRRIVTLNQCRSLSSPPTEVRGGCDNIIQADGTIRPPGGIVGIMAFEQYDEYYGAKGDGCKNYYCATKSTFQGWEVSYTPSTPSAHTMVNVVGKYKLDVFYDSSYVSTPETDQRRDALKQSFPKQNG